jgi:hypothetical protein
MSVTREELAAFADDELVGPRRSEVVAAIEAEPALAVEVARHRALKKTLSAHFAPILDEPLSETLTALLGRHEPKVADFTAARQRRAVRGIPRWSWLVGPALAASLALAVFLPRGGAEAEGYAGPRLAAALNDQLVATQARGAPIRILLSFRAQGGQFCRAFSGDTQSGIACKDPRGWKLGMSEAGSAVRGGDYRMSSSTGAAIMAKAQSMAIGPALDAREEESARGRGWQ